MSERSPLDRCPGLLRPFIADDGALVRLRMPGGRVATSVLREVVEIAAVYGAPVVQLTSRGNLQVRALPDPLPLALVEAVEATGLLPSASHERVRNILAAPLARDLDELVGSFDAALMAEPRLAALPGRFLFAFSDAAGSVLSERWDVAYQRDSATSGTLLVGHLGSAVHPDDAVTATIEVALRFVATAPDGAWNVSDLPEAALRDLLPVGAVADDRAPGWDGPKPAISRPLAPGVVGDDVVVAVPLAMLTREHVDALAEVSDSVAITPWRSIAVRGGAAQADVLRRAGLVTGPEGPWARLSACVGAPSCRRTTVPTLDLARSAAETVASRGLTATQDVHVVGCERRCGTGRSDRVLVAPPTVDDVVSALTTPATAAIRGEQ